MAGDGDQPDPLESPTGQWCFLTARGPRSNRKAEGRQFQTAPDHPFLSVDLGLRSAEPPASTAVLPGNQLRELIERLPLVFQGCMVVDRHRDVDVGMAHDRLNDVRRRAEPQLARPSSVLRHCRQAFRLGALRARR